MSAAPRIIIETYAQSHAHSRAHAYAHMQMSTAPRITIDVKTARCEALAGMSKRREHSKSPRTPPESSDPAVSDGAVRARREAGLAVSHGASAAAEHELRSLAAQQAMMESESGKTKISMGTSYFTMYDTYLCYLNRVSLDLTGMQSVSSWRACHSLVAQWARRELAQRPSGASSW